MSGHILLRTAVVLLVGAVIGAAAVLAVRDGPDPAEAGQSEGVASPRAPEVAAAAAPLTSPVTRIATDASAPAALALVDHAHTAVVAGPGRDRLRAGHLARELGVPLVTVDAPVGSVTEGTGRSAERASQASDAAAALRRMAVARAVLVGDVTDDVPRAGGVRETVRLRPSTDRHPSGRQLIRWAAGGREPGARVDPGFDDGAVQDLVDSLPDRAGPTAVATLVRPKGRGALQVALAAHAVGHAVVATTSRDLRGDADLIDRLAQLSADGDGPPQVVLGGAGMARLDRREVARQVAVAATGVQLPGGGQLVTDPERPHRRRYVGLYGVPQSSALGALGEQPVDASVARTRRIARQYQRVVDDDVDIIGCFEIIAAVASSSAGGDRNYANELPVSELEPAVRAARRAGLYVLLDIQPGRSDFLAQAKRYRRLLQRPHVGLALDPEWRLRSDEKHLEQIGSVGIEEVNEVSDWLADLTRRRRLPQKMLLIHQFRLSMVRDRELLDTSRDELSYVIQMDGQGPQGSKIDTWRSITAAPPDRVLFGWKNFYDEDSPTRSPAETMALTPPPVFVSYQ